jgi:hypothetical protein
VLHGVHLAGLSFVILLLSVTSYFIVEAPFRDPGRIGTRPLLTAMFALFFVSMGVALPLYRRAGVIRNVPELGISVSEGTAISHSTYNSRVYEYDKSFERAGRKRVLVVGNSWARDWANILLESTWAKTIDLSYVFDPSTHSEFEDRAAAADVIFFVTTRRNIVQKLGYDKPKAYAVGPKNFGASSGIFYNYRGANYYDQRTEMLPETLKEERSLAEEWGDRYVSLIAKVKDNDGKVPVFTPDHMFISVDCRHLTQAGARMIARLIENDLYGAIDGKGSTTYSE